jgi:GNAT superfamily N-acetyltransferase
MPTEVPLPVPVPETVPEVIKSAGLRDDEGSYTEGDIVYIREAVPEDNHELQKLQAQCPQGRSLIVSTVNTPDFFARVKAYESYKVFVACKENIIIGSGACAIRDALVSGKTRRVGYEFQYFTSPNHRRKNIARRLRQRIEEHLIQCGAQLSYALIMEDNLPSMRLFEGEGFNLHRTLLMPVIAVQKEMVVPSVGIVRPARLQDFANIAALLNLTWKGRELYEPASAEALAQFICRTPAFDYDDLLVLENNGEILACLGAWDWSEVMRVTVKSLSRKLKMTGWILTTTRILPRFPKPGDIMKQMMLIFVGFKEPVCLSALIRHLNNHVLRNGTEQLFCICERGDMLLKSLKGFIRVDTAMHLYTKPLAQNVSMAGMPVFVSGIDL